MDELQRPRYTPEILVNALRQEPERPLMQLLDGPVLNVGQVHDRTSQFVKVLEALEVTKGDRIALLSSNLPEVIYICNAIQLVGAIYVPMHPLGGLADHQFIIEDSGVDILVFDAERHSERAEALGRALAKLRLIALGESGLGPNLCALADAHEPSPLIAPKVGPADVVRLGYSGGTTGKPKAMASTHRTGLATLQVMMAEWEWPSLPRVLVCTPLSHAGAALFIPTLLRGGSMLVIPAFDPVAVMAAIEKHKLNCVMLVPAMIYSLLDHPRFDDFDLSSLETVFYGASAISPMRLKEAIERIGPVFSQFYGQAEAPMSVCLLRKHEHDINDLQRLASCGRPVPWIDVALLDANNRPVSDGEPGELCIRGSLVMDGYRDAPELTAAAFDGGWLHSGDVAVRDPGGFLRIIDRVKDMIVTGGFNVYPREIEDVIAEHPAVAQVAVIGVRHPKWGEAITALVVERGGATVSADELTTLVSARKGAFQAPKRVIFVAEIPLTPVGKPDKKLLRRQYS